LTLPRQLQAWRLAATKIARGSREHGGPAWRLLSMSPTGQKACGSEKLLAGAGARGLSPLFYLS